MVEDILGSLSKHLSPLIKNHHRKFKRLKRNKLGSCVYWINLILPLVFATTVVLIVWIRGTLPIIDPFTIIGSWIISSLLVYFLLYFLTSKFLLPKYPPKVTLNVLAPLHHDISTLGDGFLIAAGAMAGGHQFQDHIKEIRFFNHRNDPHTAFEKTNEIINSFRTNNEPICIVCTISEVVSQVKQAISNATNRDDKLRNRISVIFTVTSTLRTKTDSDIFIRHFYKPKQEADKLFDHWKDAWEPDSYHDDSDGSPTLPYIIIVSTRQEYSNVTVQSFLSNFSDRARASIRLISFNHETNFNSRKPLLDSAFRNTGRKEKPPFVLCVGFDTVLLESLTEVIKSNRSKSFKLYSSLPLSVKDWQTQLIELLREKGANNNPMVQFPQIDIPTQNDGARIFREKLTNCNFTQLISDEENCEKIFGETSEKVSKWFTKDQQSAFKDIQPNYISAYSYDCVRLFAEMAAKDEMKLASVLERNNTPYSAVRPGPFGAVKFFESESEVNISLDSMSPLSA